MRYDIESALLASKRAARVLHWEMGRGRASLAAIASTATLVGLFGTVYEIRSWYGNLIGCTYGDCAGGPSEAIVPTAAGVLIAILAVWCYRSLCARLETFDIEMRVASLELANALSHLRQRD